MASLLLVGGNAVAADPTLHQIYQAAEAGNYREAQSMVDQVLRNHPNSAKAHFVEAELLATQSRLLDARAEPAIAERHVACCRRSVSSAARLGALRRQIGLSSRTSTRNFSVS
jgi:thioredoxin-like negative regulator of GroEL